MDPDYVCMYRLRFRDGGEPEYGVLHRGTKDACDRVMDAVPAIAYNGPRDVQDSTVAVVQLEEGM